MKGFVAAVLLLVPVLAFGQSKVDFEKSPRPEYPKRLLDKGQGGSVELAVRLDAAGQVIETKVLKSSGVPALDQAAVDAAKQAKYRGSPDGNPSDITVSYTFEADAKKG